MYNKEGKIKCMKKEGGEGKIKKGKKGTPVKQPGK